MDKPAHLLTMPQEILHKIMYMVLDDELECWMWQSEPPLHKPVCKPLYIPLGYDKSFCETIYSGALRRQPPVKSRNISTLALTCSALRRTSHQFMAKNYKFVITISPEPQHATMSATAFRKIGSLNDDFRGDIHDIAVFICPPSQLFHGATTREQAAEKQEDSLLLLKRVTKDLALLLELLPGVSSIHIIWGYCAGNTGYMIRFDQFSQRVFAAVRAELKSTERRVYLTGQSIMGMIADRKLTQEVANRVQIW